MTKDLKKAKKEYGENSLRYLFMKKNLLVAKQQICLYQADLYESQQDDVDETIRVLRESGKAVWRERK